MTSIFHFVPALWWVIVRFRESGRQTCLRHRLDRQSRCWPFADPCPTVSKGSAQRSAHL